ncbi:MAG: winged helix-turn-helix domain-containing protein [Thermoproteota archaeon]|nr:winged helix-turn-helix domain-containing protein [Thermoproteota archaeon]
MPKDLQKTTTTISDAAFAMVASLRMIGLVSLLTIVTILLQQQDEALGPAAFFTNNKGVSPSSSFNKLARYRAKDRDRIDILSHILEVANGNDAKKIRIMNKANLSYVQLKEYLMLLIENDLLCYNLDRRTFKTTEKGLRFLDTYNHIDAVLKP